MAESPKEIGDRDFVLLPGYLESPGTRCARLEYYLRDLIDRHLALAKAVKLQDDALNTVIERVVQIEAELNKDRTDDSGD